jgi:hypothetical protein
MNFAPLASPRSCRRQAPAPTATALPSPSCCAGGIERGDVLVVVRLDRLARSVSHLLQVVETLQARGAHFRSLRDPIDTSTPQGMFSLQVLGAVAQLERSLISERTKSGIAAAKARGKLPGNPALRHGVASGIADCVAGRDRHRVAAFLATVDTWLPTVRAMRPAAPWGDVVAVLNRRGGRWTDDSLARAVKLAARGGMVPASVMKRAERREPDTRLTHLVCAIRLANPDLSIRDIGRQLEAMRERTPRGGAQWSPSSVKALLDRGVALGLLPASVDERIAA